MTAVGVFPEYIRTGLGINRIPPADEPVAFLSGITADCEHYGHRVPGISALCTAMPCKHLMQKVFFFQPSSSHNTDSDLMAKEGDLCRPFRAQQSTGTAAPCCTREIVLLPFRIIAGHNPEMRHLPLHKPASVKTGYIVSTAFKKACKRIRIAYGNYIHLAL